MNGGAPAARRQTPDQRAALEARAWRGIRALVLDRYDRRKEVCDSLDMSFIRVKALRYLAEEPLTMRELAARLSTDAPYTTLVVGDLERRGLVARSAHPTDRRSKIVTATPDGVAAARRAEDILNEPPEPVLQLDSADIAALDRIVARLLGSGD
ncbi:MarR family winged helix-turn-helix transcriptional regulator [Rugosimonospora africana]|uniref:Putative transcription regulator protein, MarR n=1 Tax=Rugosimonospora africana TaxID=556532 RepID=A0A8J3QPK7_9ACTN|nr:MarR family transcriptional regulator [Rugosimonospora africana]GIH13400.1 putative transcription regulator protein, MarR [Rugosimonospora africana]